MRRSEYSANESLSTTDAKRYARMMARVNYTPKAQAGVIEITVKLVLVAGVISTFVYLLVKCV